MTQERLRELLHDRVADETMPDRSERAWQAARAVRRRRRLGAAAGLVIATVGVSAGVAAVQSTPPAPPTDRGISDASQRPETPDATYRGVPLWWSPDQFEERELPPVASPLPADIDLDSATSRDVLIPRAVAAFARGKTVLLVPPDDGPLVSVDVSRLQKVTKPNGYSYFPTPTLTTDGALLVFTQPHRRIAVYTIATATWANEPVVTAASDASPDPGFDTESAQQYGPVVDGATSWGMGVAALPVRDPSTYLSGPEFLVARGSVLAFMERLGDGLHNRYKDCCPVAGWLDDDTVVYESRQSEPVLVSWRLGTHDFGLVARIHGAYDVASFAL